VFFYFDFETYRRMLSLARAEQNAAGRRRLLFILLGIVPLVAGFHAVCFALDYVLFPRLWTLPVRTPVFIVGHARSGTTLMHRLMSEDADRFSFFLLYEMFFPSLLQKKAWRELGRLDRRFLGGRLERRIADWDRRKFASTKDMHSTGLFAPEEDDFVHAFSCASGFWIVLLPYMGLLDFYYVDDRPERRRRRLMRFYRECVKRQLYANGADKIHLSKNPTFSGRVASLIEEFPDARIVVMMRNPYETIPSLLKLMKRSWELRRWDEPQMKRSLGALADQSFHTYLYPLEVLRRHPDTRCAVVDYRELVDAPKRTVEQVYAQLGFEITPAYERALIEHEKRAKAHETTHRYSLAEFGLDANVIHERLAELFERYGWERDGATGAQRPTVDKDAGARATR